MRGHGLKETIAVFATLTLTVATFCMMIHGAAWVAGHASFKAVCGWLVPISIAALAMAFCNAPAPGWEKERG